MTLADLTQRLDDFASARTSHAELQKWFDALLAADTLGAERNDSAPWDAAPDETRLFWRLVYGIAVEGSAVRVDMSLTSPGCPSGPEIMGDAEQHVRAMPGVTDVTMNLVWSPFWTPDRIEPRVRAYMGF